MEEIVYFELNNWFGGEDYPPCEPIASWVHEYRFNKDEWCKENKLCVLAGNIDMSQNWCIAAPIEWIEKNLPKILTDEEYTYYILSYFAGATKKVEHRKKYSDFRRFPDEYGDVEGRFGWSFPEYAEENIGVRWRNEDGSPDEDVDEGDGED